jgi:butyryl-CoA dehydrogenase
MLMFQRAVVEGSLSLLMQCSYYVDLQKAGTQEQKDRSHLLLEILTPVAKSYPSEMGIVAISQGLQCLGGSGYCDDYPLEQYYRDARIHPIHEGTTGIQGMDLLGRKVMMQEGRAFHLYLEEVSRTVAAAGQLDGLFSLAARLEEALGRLKSTTERLVQVALEEGAEKFLADATLYLDFFGIVTIAWQWLLQGISIQTALAGNCTPADQHFYRGKMFALQFFFEYELPKTLALEKRLLNPDGLTVEMTAESFND